jgi:hypothetical protein
MKSSRRTRGPALLEAFPAINGAPLRWFEGYSSLFPTLRTHRGGFHTPIPLTTEQLASLCLASLAPLRLVFEPFVCEEKLLSRSENKLRSAVDTLEDAIPIFHTQLLADQGPALRLTRWFRRKD